MQSVKQNVMQISFAESSWVIKAAMHNGKVSAAIEVSVANS
jgi:hypothetical protein